MRRAAFAGLCLLVGLTVVPALGLATASATPVGFDVSGSGVGLYPAFDPTIVRYAVTTTADTAGSVTVTVPPGSTVDGVPASGPTPVTGLAEGDEIAVGVGGTSYALVYLPPDFPALTVTTHAAGLAAGYVGLGLTTFGAGASFETLIDRNGVPVYLRRGVTSDFKRQPNGDLTTFRPTELASPASGSDLVTLDEQFQETGRQHMVSPLTDTDNHDAEKLADGSTILVGFEPQGDPTTGYLDATIQKLDPSGNVVFQWNSADHMDPLTETLNPLLWPPIPGVDQRIDYAHINSVEEIQDGTGDLLVSFRHLSAVYRIATEPRTGVSAGDVIWRLGGRHSDFDFVNDPDSGPCAQHTASMLLSQGDGHDHVLVFDNGSGPNTGSLPGCVDPSDSAAAGISRQRTRIAEWSLDTSATPHTATRVWSYEPKIYDPVERDPFAFFAGSARRLGNGDTLIGWADERAMLATEVAPDKTLLWEVQTPDTGNHRTRYATYRASLIDYTDAIDPEVHTDQPDDTVYVQGDTVAPTYHCTDRGGSNLATCASTGLDAGSLDTSTVGSFAWQVTATDGEGNTTSVVRHYTVRPAGRAPDGMIRKRGSTWWKGGNVYGAASDQTVRQRAHRRHTATTRWRVQNDGERSDSFVLSGTRGTRRFRVHYFVGSTDVTRAVVAGTFRTASVAPGAARSLRVEVTPTRRARTGSHRTVRLRATSVASSLAVDTVGARVTARR